MSDVLYIPEITFFINQNPYCGSLRGFNYRVSPVMANTENDIDAHLEVVTWYGKLCSEKSERQAEARFPLDTDGLQAVRQWLIEQESAFRSNI